MTEHDKDLEDYLRGDTRLSQAYRTASDEKAPAHLDEAILAQARAEARRKPSWDRLLAPVALAATMVLGVNLAWNLYQVEPVPDPVVVGEAGPTRAPKRLAKPAEAAPPPVAAEKESRSGADADEDVAMAATETQALEEKLAGAPAPADSMSDRAVARSEAERGERRASSAAPSMAPEAGSPARVGKSAPMPPAAAPDIERLIKWVHSLEETVFIVDGEEFTPPQAAVYLRIQWREAGSRIHTVQDFIEKCARRSPATGEPYRFRFADGKTREVADVLTERLKLR